MPKEDNTQSKYNFSCRFPFLEGSGFDSSILAASCDNNCEANTSLSVEMEKMDEILKMDER